MLLRRLTVIGVMCLCLGIVLPSPAFAYLDPGAGSYIFQLILASLVGALFVVGVYWKKVKAFVAGLFRRDRAVASSDGEDDEQS